MGSDGASRVGMRESGSGSCPAGQAIYEVRSSSTMTSNASVLTIYTEVIPNQYTSVSVVLCSMILFLHGRQRTPVITPPLYTVHKSIGSICAVSSLSIAWFSLSVPVIILLLSYTVLVCHPIIRLVPHWFYEPALAVIMYQIIHYRPFTHACTPFCYFYIIACSLPIALTLHAYAYIPTVYDRSTIKMYTSRATYFSSALYHV